MATLKINGDTSGYVELVSPAVAGSTSIELDKILVSDSSGNVGIGTTSPNTTLDIVSPSSAEAVNIRGRSADDIGQLKFYENDGTTSLARLDSRTTHFEVGSYNELRFSAGGVSNSHVVIDTSGNVGIGTTSPLNKFVVAEATGQHGVEIAPGTLSYIQAYDRATGDYGDLSIDAQTIRFATDNGTERMRIASNGMVQVGGVTNDSGGTKFKVGGSGNDGEITLHADTTASYITAYDRTAGAYHPIISTASEHQLNGGYVTTPNQPVVFVSRTSTQAVTTNASAGTILDFTSTQYNIGGHFNISNNKFTAPITGRYEISWSYGTNINGASVYRTFIWKTIIN